MLTEKLKELKMYRMVLYILFIVFLPNLLISQGTKNSNVSQDIIETKNEIEPHILKDESGTYQIVLPEQIKNVLASYDPSFKIFKQENYGEMLIKIYSFSENQTPFAVVGDFNGDSKKDVILNGHTQDAVKVIAVLSGENLYQVHEIISNTKSEPLIQTTYISFTAKGNIKSPYEDESLELQADAFDYNYFEKASSLYYLKNNSFIRYTTAD